MPHVFSAHAPWLNTTARRLCLIWVICPLAASLIGCGGAATAPVSGTVTVNGRPTGPGMIIFLPVSEDESLPPTMATFETDGRYTLPEGSAIGKHQVVIQARGVEGDYGVETTAAVATAIPLRYADPEASGLTAEVVDDDNQIDFKLHFNYDSAE